MLALIALCNDKVIGKKLKSLVNSFLLIILDNVCIFYKDQ